MTLKVTRMYYRDGNITSILEDFAECGPVKLEVGDDNEQVAYLENWRNDLIADGNNIAANTYLNVKVYQDDVIVEDFEWELNSYTYEDED